MNKRNFISLFVFALLFTTGDFTWAQTAPHPPVLAPVGDMKWTITVQPKVVSPPGIFNPWLLEYSHSGGWTRLVVTCGQSQKNEWWLTHGYVLARCPPDNLIVIVRQLPLFPPSPYAPAGFFGVEQVKPADNRGVATFQASECSYFSNLPPASPSDPAQQSDATSSDGYEAWFDVKTGLPKGYRKGDKTYLYEFFPAVPGEVQVPPDWKAALDRYFDRLRNAGLMPANSN